MSYSRAIGGLWPESIGSERPGSYEDQAKVEQAGFSTNKLVAQDGAKPATAKSELFQHRDSRERAPICCQAAGFADVLADEVTTRRAECTDRPLSGSKT